MAETNSNSAISRLSEVPVKKPYEAPTLSALDFDKTASGGNTSLVETAFSHPLS